MRVDKGMKSIAPRESSHGDKLGLEVIRRYRISQDHRSLVSVGNRSLQQVLIDCYNQKHGIITPQDQELIDSLGNDAYVNLTDLKTSALEATLKNILLGSNDMPFLVSPTPIPELSERGQLEALQMVKKEYFEGGVLLTPEQLWAHIRRIKAAQLNKEEEVARIACNAMQKLIKDQCLEGGYTKAMTQFLRDFSIYPFAAMHGPVPIKKPMMVWKGNDIKMEMKDSYLIERISPFDIVWTPDSTDTQNGTGVTIIERLTKQALYQMKISKAYIESNITKVLDTVSSGTISLDWATRNPENKNYNAFIWNEGATIESLRHYGVFKGSDLQDYGCTGLEADVYYNACVVVVDGITIQAQVSPVGGVYTRPVHTATYETSENAIAGIGIAQKLRDVERVYISLLRMMVTNSGFTSKPIGEVLVDLISEDVPPEDIASLIPGTITPTKSAAGYGTTAYRLYNIQSHALTYAQLMQIMMDLADRISQIPAAMHGEPVGTGANRTFRGMAMLNSNVLKTVQSGIQNLDLTLHVPIGEMLYNYNMRFSDDSNIKGDAQVIAQGASGLLQKEIEKQNSMEVLQILANAGPLADSPRAAKAFSHAMDNLLHSLDVPDYIMQDTPANVGVPQAAPVEEYVQEVDTTNV